MSKSGLSDSFEYLRPLELFQFFQCGDCLYTSESDVYRRQIMTYKDGPRTERVSESEVSP